MKARVTAPRAPGSPVGLGIAQATLAAGLAIGAVVLGPLGLSQGFILGAAGVVLVASGVLLVVRSDPEGRKNRATASAGG